METVTLKLSVAAVRAIKENTGCESTAAALRALVKRTHGATTPAQLRRSLVQSRREEKAGKGQTFTSAHAAMKWLET